jgi:hypothetical protein
VEYSRHTIKLTDQAGIRECLQALADQGLIAVNIAGSPEGDSLPISQENWDAILAAVPESLYVEALPFREFTTRIREDISQIIELTLALRAKMRVEYVQNLEAPIQAFLNRVGRTLTLIGCYILQCKSPESAEIVKRLRHDLKMLSESSFEHCDNVRSMDDLQYHILPTLKLLQKTFRK